MKKIRQSKILAVTFLFFVASGSLFLVPFSTAQSSSATTYPQIQNTVRVNVSESQSAQILVPLNNSGSMLGWTDLRLSYVDPNPGIKLTTDPLLFVEGPVAAQSDNFSLSIGVSVGDNVTVGQYAIPFTLTARSSIYSPSISTSVSFDVVVTVLKSAPRPFPILFLFPPFILAAAGIMIGIVISWSRDWNISDVKK